MVHQLSPKVPFTRENVKLCSCGACPIQAASKCAGDKMAKIDAALKVQPLQATDIPLVYCATGKATCTDLDMHKKCMCPTCAVFVKYALSKAAPIAYHCRDGKAE